MARLLVVIVLAAAVSSLADFAQAACVNPTYDYEGSEMQVAHCPEEGTIKIYYTSPSNAERQKGVLTGALLFEGTSAAVEGSDARVLAGKARVFQRRCAEVLFEATGRMEGSSIVIEGSAPKVSVSCRELGASPTRMQLLLP